MGTKFSGQADDALSWTMYRSENNMLGSYHFSGIHACIRFSFFVDFVNKWEINFVSTRFFKFY